VSNGNICFQAVQKDHIVATIRIHPTRLFSTLGRFSKVPVPPPEELNTSISDTSVDASSIRRRTMKAAISDSLQLETGFSRTYVALFLPRSRLSDLHQPPRSLIRKYKAMSRGQFAPLRCLAAASPSRLNYRSMNSDAASFPVCLLFPLPAPCTIRYSFECIVSSGPAARSLIWSTVDDRRNGEEFKMKIACRPLRREYLLGDKFVSTS